jgi:ATP-dependent DNA helicase RecQ
MPAPVFLSLEKISSENTPAPVQPLDILRSHWGYDAFRPLQAEIIGAVLEGRDVLALMPTGGGKSLCFQVPALCRPGICLVVSPLIALMKDQVENLRKRGIPAVALHSGVPYRDIDRLLDNCAHGAPTKFLYVSPERLQTPMFRERVGRMPINLLAVDEAHCISQWGYDFRPPYLEIAALRELLPGVPVLALTATATARVAEDIRERLAFRPNAAIFQQGFARPNLSYVVLHEEAKPSKLLEILQKVPGSSVVYVRNRRKTKETARFLQQNRISAGYYHAGLTAQERSEAQEAWIAGRTRVIVATNAFGMGIDKPDVRTVVHLDPPDNLEAYFQEAGRGGRDGNKAYAVLLWNENDRTELENQYVQAYPELAEIRQVYRALGSYFQLAVGGGLGESFDFDLTTFATNFKFEPVRCLNALRTLQRDGWIELTDAVFQPAQLQVLVSREELYDFQLKNPRFDPLLKTILRAYQGVSAQPVPIRENQLAGHLRIPLETLHQYFAHLNKAGVVQYRPQKDRPQLIFLRERVSADNLLLNAKLYAFLRDRQRERLDALLEYVQAPRCRSQLLLAYFGETASTPCGQCEVCLKRHREEPSVSEFEALRRQILALLRKSPLRLTELAAPFPASSQGLLGQVLNTLADEGEIVISAGDWVKLKGQ